MEIACFRVEQKNISYFITDEETTYHIHFDTDDIEYTINETLARKQRHLRYLYHIDKNSAVSDTWYTSLVFSPGIYDVPA